MDLGDSNQLAMWLVYFGGNVVTGVAAVTLYGVLRVRFEGESHRRESVLIGLIFGIAALAAMRLTIQVAPGIIIDSRNIFLVLGGPIRRPHQCCDRRRDDRDLSPADRWRRDALGPCQHFRGLRVRRGYRLAIWIAHSQLQPARICIDRPHRGHVHHRPATCLLFADRRAHGYSPLRRVRTDRRVPALRIGPGRDHERHALPHVVAHAKPSGRRPQRRLGHDLGNRHQRKFRLCLRPLSSRPGLFSGSIDRPPAERHGWPMGQRGG